MRSGRILPPDFDSDNVTGLVKQSPMSSRRNVTHEFVVNTRSACLQAGIFGSNKCWESKQLITFKKEIGQVSSVNEGTAVKDLVAVALDTTVI